MSFADTILTENLEPLRRQMNRSAGAVRMLQMRALVALREQMGVAAEPG